MITLGRVNTLTKTHTNTFLSSWYVIALMQATPAVAEIGHNSQRTNVNLYFYRMPSLYVDIVKQHKALFRHVPHLSVKMTAFFYVNDFMV